MTELNLSYNKAEIIIGVISDTHGLLRPEAIKALHGSDLVFHAGDIGDTAIIKRLEEIAPVAAIRGNVDDTPALMKFPFDFKINIGIHSVYMIHNISDLEFKPEEKNIDAVIFGHSHKSLISYKNDVLYFNPGAAGKRRFNYPITTGQLKIKDGKIVPSIKILLE